MIAYARRSAALAFAGLLSGCAVSQQYICNATVEGMAGDECPKEKCHLVSERYAFSKVHANQFLGGTNSAFLAKIERSDPSAFSDNGRMAGIAYHASEVIRDSDAPGSIGRVCSIFHIFTLGLFPWAKTVETSQKVDVIREDGKSESFTLWAMKKDCYSTLRLNLLFPYSDTDPRGFCVVNNSWHMDYDLPMGDCRAKAYAKGVRLALAKMELPSGSAGKVDNFIKEDAVHKMREKELRQMKDSGVLSVEEYQAEIEKLGTEVRK